MYVLYALYVCMYVCMYTTHVLTEGYVPSGSPLTFLRTTVRRGWKLARPPGGSVGHPVIKFRNACCVIIMISSCITLHGHSYYYIIKTANLALLRGKCEQHVDKVEKGGAFSGEPIFGLRVRHQILVTCVLCCTYVCIVFFHVFLCMCVCMYVYIPLATTEGPARRISSDAPAM
jgi:hypothetical protein